MILHFFHTLIGYCFGLKKVAKHNLKQKFNIAPKVLDIPEPANIELSDLKTRRGDRSVDDDQRNKIMGQESQSLAHLFHFTRNRVGGLQGRGRLNSLDLCTWKDECVMIRLILIVPYF